MSLRTTALVAEDEPLLREALIRKLAEAWPDLEIVAEARDGREAIRQFESSRPDVCFLDVQMPGFDGLAVAKHIGRRAHVVFVTAYDHYAVEAFTHGAVDFLLKPVDRARLAETVERLRERLRESRSAPSLEALLERLSAGAADDPRPRRLRWICAQAGQTVQVIDVDRVDYLRSDRKHTLVAWRDESGHAAEAIVRATLKDLLERLDPDRFAQVHRSIVVNLQSIHHLDRPDVDGVEIHLKGRTETLPVSRTFLHVFRGM